MPSQLAIDRTKLFIKNYGKDIATAINGTGLYWEAVVGQKCLESAYGTAALATRYNNFGGMRNNFGHGTANGWAIFLSPLECFNAYVRTLQSPTKKYTMMGVFTATSPEDQVLKIAKAGYCAPPPTPAGYVAKAQSAIDATRQILPLGKIMDLSAGLTQIASL
jgi:flagellum-specific peptidoglycan hydrolase FlgJ